MASCRLSCMGRGKGKFNIDTNAYFGTGDSLSVDDYSNMMGQSKATQSPDVFLNSGFGKGRGTFTDSTGCDAVSIPEPLKVKLGRWGRMEYTIGTSIKCGMGGAARYKHTFLGHGNCRRCGSHVSGLSWPWFECSCCGCNGYCMGCLEKYGTVYEKADCARDE